VTNGKIKREFGDLEIVDASIFLAVPALYRATATVRIITRVKKLHGEKFSPSK
jgi:hypothetical protein